MQPVVIALDGPAAVGKSTIARQLAKRLDFVHIDSGAMYRGLTLALTRSLGAGDTPQEFGKKFLQIKIDLSVLAFDVSIINGRQYNSLQGKEVTLYLRSLEVSNRVGYVADSYDCREWVNGLLRKLGGNAQFVLDGRDIGSEVFPNTPFKFFLQASLEVRAKRRQLDFQKMGYEMTYSQIKKDIEKRDQEDYNRRSGALRKMKDAIEIEASTNDPNEVTARILSYLQFSY